MKKKQKKSKKKTKTKRKNKAKRAKRKINKIVNHFNEKTDGLLKASTRKASQLCLDSINNINYSNIR